MSVPRKKQLLCTYTQSDFDFCSCQALLMYCVLTVSGFVTAVKRKGTDSILGSAGGEATKTMKGSTGESKKVQCYIVYQSLLLTYTTYRWSIRRCNAQGSEGHFQLNLLKHPDPCFLVHCLQQLTSVLKAVQYS